MMITTMKRSVIATVLLAAGLTGCQDLEIANPNAPDRERALNSAGDVETLVVSSWEDMWSRLYNSGSAINTMPLIADELSGTYANSAALELSSEPRPPLNNNPIADAHDTGRFQWEDWYKAISSTSDGIAAIHRGLRIRTGEDLTDHTTRTWAFAKFQQAISLGYLSLLFDKAFVVNEYSDLENPETVPLLEHEMVRDTAIAYMLQAIDTMTATSFSTPETWIPTRSYSSARLARIGHSYIVRFLVYGARTPEEREAVDWNRVLQHIDAGITEDYEVDLQSGVRTASLYLRSQSVGTFVAYGDYKLIGPSDVSGNFAAWLAQPLADRERFLITTPDRRITGTTPTSDGSYFRYRANNPFSPERGTYHHSHYQWYRGVQQYGNVSGLTSSGIAKVMTVDEMNLIRAEALIRLGRADEAVPLINATRTREQSLGRSGPTVPNLPPITVDGVPESDTCVPRLDGINCADLMGALMYERMIELAVLDALRGYLDSRGWGRLPEGTFVHFPIPGRELGAINQPLYSFGGFGGPGAAVCSQPFCD